MKSAISVTTILVTSSLKNSLQQNGHGNAGFLYPKLQGIVTYMSMSPVEVFATEIKIVDCLIILLKALNCLFFFFYRSKVELEPHILDSLFFAVQRLP